jgi:hypothetical protein
MMTKTLLNGPGMNFEWSFGRKMIDKLITNLIETAWGGHPRSPELPSGRVGEEPYEAIKSVRDRRRNESNI